VLSFEDIYMRFSIAYVALALLCSMAHASLKFEDYNSMALLGAVVRRVECPKPAVPAFGRVNVERDEHNFIEHTGTINLAIDAESCSRLERRTSKFLSCYGHARLDLFIEHERDGSVYIVDFGFPRNEGPCVSASSDQAGSTSLDNGPRRDGGDYRQIPD